MNPKDLRVKSAKLLSKARNESRCNGVAHLVEGNSANQFPH